MGKTEIKCTLSSTSIDDAIKQIKQYKRDFERKVNLFRQRLAEEISSKAQSGFNASGVDDDLRRGTRPAEVTVDVNDKGDISIVIASGEDAVWCEFGAGVYHNTPVGSSPHPYGAENGLTIGSYGKGNGKRQVWGYYADPGDKTSLTLTHGTAATMPLYKAVKAIAPKAVSIAREVFG